MSIAGLNQFLKKKSYEVCYATFRISFAVKSQSLASKMEGGALDLLGSSLGNDYRAAGAASSLLEQVLRLGSDVGLINPANASAVILELGNINSAIAELNKQGTVAEPADLGGIFSSLPTEIKVGSDKSGDSFSNASPREDERGGEPMGGGRESGNGVAKSAIRQSAILEILRQNNVCRLRDIQESLGGASERTIRYDLQDLIGRGLIKRTGNGGPATFYQQVPEVGEEIPGVVG